jgi:hypothetical protein
MWSYNYPHNVNEAGVKMAGCLDAKYCNRLPIGVFPTSFYETVSMCSSFSSSLGSSVKNLKFPEHFLPFILY